MSDTWTTIEHMNDPLLGLIQALSRVTDAWAVTSAGERLPVDVLAPSQLVAATDALGALRRHIDAIHARVAAEIARQSRPDLGSEGLAKKQGYRSPIALVAASTGGTAGDAARLVSVGEATTPRRTFSGEDAPARHPHVAKALAAGSIGLPAASAIITMLDRVALRCGRDQLLAAEALLADNAPGLSLEQLARLISRAEAHLDPDGIEPREAEARENRELHLVERGGMLVIRGALDAASAAPVKTAIEALVTADLRAQGRATSAGSDRDSDAPRRTVPQMQADALVLLASHMLGCRSADVPLEGATVVVRMTLEQLESGTGAATVDGLATPVSVSTARRLAASGGVIPCVLGSTSDVLDWGREKRLFTRAQRLALVERDGGCAMCGLPPGMTKAHHLRWWARDAGPTDLDNGILLCESCHHRIHDNEWEIQIEGHGVAARVWFVPPPHVDPTRTRRLGGRARFDYAA